MVLKSRHQLIRQGIPKSVSKIKSQSKPEETDVCICLNAKEKILQKILIVLHAVLAFFRETSRYHCSSLLLHFDASAETGWKKRSKNMQFLLLVREALFQSVQGHRFIGIRGSYNCRVAFMEGADANLNNDNVLANEKKKILTYKRLTRFCGRY